MVVQRVPFTGAEKESLRVSLDRHREVMLWKLDGLDDEAIRRPMTPSGTSLLGLVKHLAAVEYGWFCDTFGRPHESMPFDTNNDDDDGAEVTMRWVLIHMIEETARHAGHADIVRELIDGSVGDHPRESEDL